MYLMRMINEKFHRKFEEKFLNWSLIFISRNLYNSKPIDLTLFFSKQESSISELGKHRRDQ